MSAKPKVALIVDNPLRDLDGLVLVAWHLARLGAEAWLVPMYDQGFDVRAIDADFVLLNYIRPNNQDHAYAYMRKGMKVGVLETEGMAGKSPEDFAGLITRSGGADLMDLYCVWGKGQEASLLNHHVVPRDTLKLTGCPRYDYCSSPWRASLAAPGVKPGYVLINTNFPTINPRFGKGTQDEKNSMVKGGFALDFANDYIRESGKAHKGMIELIAHLVATFPNQHFVLRPHPFESVDSYNEAIKAANFEVRQEGTSIEWLNHARALIHLNCTTAIEAAAFGIPTYSPDWLNNPTLLVPLANKLSNNITSEPALFHQLDNELGKPANMQARGGDAILEYLCNDGKSAERAANAVMETLSKTILHMNLPKSSPRFKLLDGGRKLMGPKFYRALQGLTEKAPEKARKQAKLFAAGHIAAAIARIDASAATQSHIKVTTAKESPMKRKRLSTGHSICVAAG